MLGIALPGLNYLKFSKAPPILGNMFKSLVGYSKQVRKRKKECVSRSVISNSLRSHGLEPQPPLSMEFARREYWNEQPSPSPGDLSNPGIEPASLISPTLQADSLPSEPSGKPKYDFNVNGIMEYI